MPRVYVTKTRSGDSAQSFVDQIEDPKTIIDTNESVIDDILKTIRTADSADPGSESGVSISSTKRTPYLIHHHGTIIIHLRLPSLLRQNMMI